MERFPEINLFPRLRAVGHFLAEVVRPVHQLATHGDHTFEHPLDTPVEPVTAMPTLPFDSEGNWHNPDGEAA